MLEELLALGPWSWSKTSATALQFPFEAKANKTRIAKTRTGKHFLNYGRFESVWLAYWHITQTKNVHSHFKYYTFKYYTYMRVVLNSFIWKTSSSPKKKFLSPNFRELHVFLSRYMLAMIFQKNVDVWYPQIVPGVWSLVTLHSAAAALKHLRSALRCWSLLTFIGQFWHNKSTV